MSTKSTNPTTIPTYSDAYLSGILRSVKRIALLGASDKEDRPSFEVMKVLLEQGYDVIPINPRLAGRQIHGRTVLASLGDLGTPVDMLDLFLNSTAVEEMETSLVEDPAPVLWMQIGVVSHRVAQAAAARGKQVVMNLCPKLELARLGLLGRH